MSKGNGEGGLTAAVDVDDGGCLNSAGSARAFWLSSCSLERSVRHAPSAAARLRSRCWRAMPTPAACTHARASRRPSTSRPRAAHSFTRSRCDGASLARTECAVSRYKISPRFRIQLTAEIIPSGEKWGLSSPHSPSLGHLFGLDLVADDRRALLSFVRARAAVGVPAGTLAPIHDNSRECFGSANALAPSNICELALSSLCVSP